MPSSEPAGNPPLLGESRRSRAQLQVMVGLVFTLGGLVQFLLLLPSTLGQLLGSIPWFVLTFLGSWFGGILVGNFRSPLAAGGPSGLAGQLPLGFLSTVGGAAAGALFLSSVAASGPTTPEPTSGLVMVAAAVASWLGGFLMGNGRRRFVRRRRRSSVPEAGGATPRAPLAP